MRPAVLLFFVVACTKHEPVDKRAPCTTKLVAEPPPADWKSWTVQLTSKPSDVKITKVDGEDTTAIYFGSYFMRHAAKPGMTATQPIRLEVGECAGNKLDIPLTEGRTLEMLGHLTWRSKGPATVLSDERT